jgi:mannose-6-phosphate isomerase-like protein (cupin superfamily)
VRRSPINLAEKLAQVAELWSPRVVAEMNDYQFKVVRVQGKFVWHRHLESDETFIVLKGELEIAFRDGKVLLRSGEMYVVPKGHEHITSADTECHVLVVEPRGVVNTGDAGGTLTARNDVWA